MNSASVFAFAFAFAFPGGTAGFCFSGGNRWEIPGGTRGYPGEPWGPGLYDGVLICCIRTL